LWDETRSRGPEFDDLETTLLKNVPVLIEVRTYLNYLSILLFPIVLQLKRPFIVNRLRIVK